MKTKILSLIVFVLILSSCETEDTNVTVTEADLIGVWNLTEQTIENGLITYSGNGQNLSATYSAYAKNIEMTLTFTDNPKKIYATGKYTIVTTVSALGQTQTEEEEIYAVNDPDLSPTWELNGNIILFSNDSDFPANMIIDSFDGTTLRLRGEVDETVSENGQSATAKATMRMALMK